MKRVIKSSTLFRHYADDAETRLAKMIGIRSWSDMRLTRTNEGKWNHMISQPYKVFRADSPIVDTLKEIGAKYITSRYGNIYFFYNTANLEAEAKSEQERFDNEYYSALDAIDISKWKPNDATIKKLTDYRARGSRVNVKAIKDKDKLFTYYYAARIMGWDSLQDDILHNSMLNIFDIPDELHAMDHQVKADNSLTDDRSVMEQKLEIPKTDLFTFDSDSCWLPKSILQFFISNNIPVHFGKRTSGARYDHNGAQWSEIEHLTIYPDSENPINYDIVVHTNERADGSIPDTYTGNGTSERVSAKQIIEDLKRTIED